MKRNRTTVGAVAEHMLSLLPPDGTPVLNRVMRAMLSRELESSIKPELYFAARDLLLGKERIGRLRGQGGQLFLTPQEQPAPDITPEVELWAEARLMEPLRRYLEGLFTKGLDLPAGGVCIVRKTAAFGPRRGQWARPDYILVSAMRFKLLPGSQVDVHSFELKAEGSGTVQAIHEALAQTRFTHFGHLVWHLPDGSKSEARLGEVQEHCSEHGIGLIRMHDPSVEEGCEILLDPIRKSTLPATIDGFLESRLTSAQCKALSQAVHGHRQ